MFCGKVSLEDICSPPGFAICWGWGREFFGSHSLFLLRLRSIHPLVLPQAKKKRFLCSYLISILNETVWSKSLFLTSFNILEWGPNLRQEHTNSLKWRNIPQCRRRCESEFKSRSPTWTLFALMTDYSLQSLVRCLSKYSSLCAFTSGWLCYSFKQQGMEQKSELNLMVLEHVNTHQ